MTTFDSSNKCLRDKAVRKQQIAIWNSSPLNNAPALYREPKKINFHLDTKFRAACVAVDLDDAKSLLKQHVDINAGNIDGITALHQACLDNNLELVQFLVEHKADVNVTDLEGWTPLHAAVQNGLLEIPKYLIENGAKLDIPSFDNELPIDVINATEDNPCDELKAYLRQQMSIQHIDADLARDLEHRVMLRDATRWLDSGKFDPPVDPVVKATPTHIAACKNYLDVMKILLKIAVVNSSLDVNAQDRDGWTPLHVSAHYGHLEMCDRLIKAGASINAVSLTNQTIVDVADESNLELITYLKEAEKNQISTKLSRIYEIHSPTPNNADKSRKHSITRSSLEIKNTLKVFFTSKENRTGQDTEDLSLDIDDVVDSKSNLTSNTPNQPALNGDYLTPSDNSNIELRQKRLSTVLAPQKVEETEAQRSTRARYQRASRRSTQGVNTEDIEEAKALSNSSNNPVITPTVESVEEVVTATSFNNVSQQSVKQTNGSQDSDNSPLNIKFASPSSKLLAEIENSVDEWRMKRRNQIRGMQQRSLDLTRTANDETGSSKGFANAAGLPYVDESGESSRMSSSSSDVEIRPLIRRHRFEARNRLVEQNGCDNSGQSSFDSSENGHDPNTGRRVASSESHTSQLPTPFVVRLAFTRDSNRAATHDLDSSSSQLLTTNENVSAPNSTPTNPVDFEKLYHLELAENSRLQVAMAQLREVSNHKLASPTITTVAAAHLSESSDGRSLDEVLAELHKVKAENAELKERNNALLSVVSRLATPSSRQVSASLTSPSPRPPSTSTS